MPELTTPLPRNIVDAIADAGFDVDDIARTAGVEPARLETGVTLEEADRFLTEAWRAVDDPSFGLRAGLMLRPERFGISGLAAMAAPTLRVALERKGRFNRLLWGDAYRIEQEGDTVTLSVEAPDESRPYSHARVDTEFASLIAFARRFTEVHVVPVRLTLRRPAPAFRALYGDIFGCPVVFGAPVNSIVFHRADTERPLVSANPGAGEWLELGAQAALEKMDDSRVTPRVRAALERMLQGDEPTLAAVASGLCMSERTLQRRLTSEGTTFRRLLDDVRCEVAQRTLAAGKRNVVELAYLLGFEDSNSFYRSFRRWTGTTPESFRKGVAA
ncbi:AraC family transcriptional regulator [Ramlibacter albus]|uniref:AraC family transcriptional regulator n=1 Tax=Ramlibacter albus TaxID=2079448 RepID=A0A923M4C5_9BURK|nr:AraC family transcriptional regulator [Ramlibacter albus]MBC5763150.1 AraC family transcriptional regulator [Ramlibacter albus]